MSLDDALRGGSFRRWYERQLIESHAWLVTAFLALIMLALALETLDVGGPLANAAALAVVAGAGAVLVLYAFRRFARQMALAEALALQAVCGACGSYGRFELLEARRSAAALSGRALHVRCRACAHEWRMG